MLLAQLKGKLDTHVALFFINKWGFSSHAVVGSASGDMYRIDLRQKGLVNGHYKGAKGSIREVACVDNYVLSVSLDRFFRVHAADSRKLIKSVCSAKLIFCINTNFVC